MKAEIETRMGKLFEADALLWMRELPANSTDLVIAESDAEWLSDSDGWVTEAARVLKPTGSLVITSSAERSSEGLALVQVRLGHWFGAGGTRWLSWVYDPATGAAAKRGDHDFSRAHQNILHLRREKFHVHLTHRGSRLGRMRQPPPSDCFRFPFSPRGMPVELVSELLAATTARGDQVVVPFGGPETLAACELLGRNWLACEPVAERRQKVARQLQNTRLRTPVESRARPR